MKYTVLLFPAIALIWINYATALLEDTMDTFQTDITLMDPSHGTFSSRILKSHRGIRYRVGTNKTLIVSAPPGYRLLVSIRVIDFRPLNQDQLKLFSVGGQVRPVIYSNTGSFQKKSYYPLEDETYDVPNGQLGVQFATGPFDNNYGYDGFELIYTVQANWQQCKSRYFRCNNGRCIADILKCDGHNHCGDRSSERNCYIYVPGTGTSIGIGFGTIFLIIAVGCGIYIIVKRSRRSVTEHTILTSHPPPTTNMPSYPPAYPQQPGTYYPPPPPPYSQGVTNPTYR